MTYRDVRQRSSGGSELAECCVIPSPPVLGVTMRNENVLEAGQGAAGKRSGVFVACAAVVIGAAQVGWLAMLYFGLRWLMPG